MLLRIAFLPFFDFFKILLSPSKTAAEYSSHESLPRIIALLLWLCLYNVHLNSLFWTDQLDELYQILSAPISSEFFVLFYVSIILISFRALRAPFYFSNNRYYEKSCELFNISLVAYFFSGFLGSILGIIFIIFFGTARENVDRLAAYTLEVEWMISVVQVVSFFGFWVVFKATFFSVLQSVSALRAILWIVAILLLNLFIFLLHPWSAAMATYYIIYHAYLEPNLIWFFWKNPDSLIDQFRLVGKAFLFG
jgi:hypothetical protein